MDDASYGYYRRIGITGKPGALLCQFDYGVIITGVQYETQK